MIFQEIETALLSADITEKIILVNALPDIVDSQSAPVRLAFKEPGRPSRPELVPASEVPRRKLGSKEGKAAFLHAIAHIEFNAINLALDAAARFPNLPDQYYQDWIRVAKDEARHFSWLQGRLQEFGFEYGDFPAHNGLWEMAVRTEHDLLARMAMVPRFLEARGLDVTPAMVDRLSQLKDPKTAEILEKILEEEIPHVAIGTRWFRYACEQAGYEPDSYFNELLREYLPEGITGKINRGARLAAGFSERELQLITA